MKAITKKSLLYAGVVLISFLLLHGCNNDEDQPTEQELAFEKLEGRWSLKSNSSILLDGEDVSLNYPNFSLSFTDGMYTTTNAGDLFRATGTWEWSDEEAGQVIIDDETIVTIEALGLDLFIFTFTVNGQGGVANGVGGAYRITLEK